MTYDMNERAARPVVVVRPPLEIPVSLPCPNGSLRTLALHELSDDQLALLASAAGGGDPMMGWRWARSCAWLLAGREPRELRL